VSGRAQICLIPGSLIHEELSGQLSSKKIQKPGSFHLWASLPASEASTGLYIELARQEEREMYEGGPDLQEAHITAAIGS
jgi:hypothetical protein